MKRVIFWIVVGILFFCGLAYSQDKVKTDRPLDVGVALSADPDIHEAVYAVLRNKGISCSGLSTRKDGTVTIIGASATEPLITAAEIQVEIDKIKAEKDIEAKIEKRIRELAIADLKAKGEIPADYSDKKDK